ncbi:MAG TPA: hypothetical protein VGS57_05175 [Thermoanaerobaculia bacterium]|jgi:hypothetical protein|nr:hypothetical protein [Thermoanaerobaculia bacterium]
MKSVRLSILIVFFGAPALTASDHLFWGGDHVRRGDVGNAGAYVTMWPNAAGPVAVDTVHGRVYWGDTGVPGKIWYAPSSGGTPVHLLTTVGNERIDDLEIDPGAQMIYWDDRANLHIYRSNVNVPSVSALPIPTATIGTLRDVALDLRPSQQKLYWLKGTRIGRANLNGTSPQMLANALPGAAYFGFALDTCADRIYVVGFEGAGPQYGAITAVDLADAGNATTVLQDPASGNPGPIGYDPRKIAIDTYHQKLYWTAAADGTTPFATIRSANVDGTNPQIEAQAAVGATWSHELALELANQGCAPKGMTWAFAGVNAPTGTVRVACSNCNPTTGDTPCSTPLPLLCIRKSGNGFPLPKPMGVNNSNQNSLWSGGVIGTTAPVVPPPTLVAANALCVQQFGTDWRVAEFHDGWGWGFQAYGGVGNQALRFWVDINDQSNGKCWN